MDTGWQRIFRERMQGFRGGRPAQAGDLSLSIKVRVVSGCFHRLHSPYAYALIDSHLDSLSPEVEFVEHESGPELLAYLAATTAGLTLAKSVIGVKKGDRPVAPLELIVRHVGDGHEYHEEVVFRIGHIEATDSEAIERQVEEAIRKLFKKSDSA